MSKKVCGKCKGEFGLSEFHKDKSRKDGYAYFCKECRRIYSQIDRVKEKVKLYQQSDKGKENAKMSRQTIEYKERVNSYERRKRCDDSNYHITQILRSRLTNAFKVQDIRKNNKTLDLLGCSLDHLKQHLESQFQEGMNWENYGEWHIDHKKPCAAFDLTDEDQQKECFNYTNLQPLWAVDNIRKSDKFDEKI